MTRKVKVTADAVLAIVQSIFNDEDVNIVVDDPSAPPSWQGKTVEEILNVEYYTFKHRPISTQTVINKMLEENGQTNLLAGLNRAFCLLSLSNIERLYSKDVDMAVLGASLEYYIQTSKIKLLEYLIEDCNIATSGIRIPVAFGNETRQAVVIFGRPGIGDIQTAASFGEMALVDVPVSIILYPDAASYSDYIITIERYDGSEPIASQIPVSSFAVTSNTVQKATPRMNAPQDTGNINLSKANSFVLVFDGYNNDFINYITAKTCQGDATPEIDNNEVFLLKITRGAAEYSHAVIVKDHQITVSADTSNETHTLALVKRGL